MVFYVPKTKHWYSSWWGIVVLSVLVIAGAVFIALGMLAVNYWHQIKSGRADFLQKKFYEQVQTKVDPAIVAIRQVVETEGDPFLGNASASNVLVEFVDYKCPICKAQEPVVQQLAAKYGYNLKVIIRDFPLESVHPGATQAGMIASCANEQGSGWYWAASNYFYSNQELLPEKYSDEEIIALADQFGLDKTKFSDCINSGRGRAEVMKDYTDAINAGANKGTPTYFLNGYKIEGAVSMDMWKNLFLKMGMGN